MDYKLILAFLGVLVTFLWFSYYIHNILLDKVKPHIFTWFVWWIVTNIWFFIQAQNWWWAWSWTTWLTWFFCIIIFILSIEHWSKKITLSDIISFILAIVAIVLWLVVELPLYSVFLISAIDALWFYPTYRKSFYHPFEENYFTFFAIWFKYNLSIFAVDEFTLLTVFYPASIIFTAYSFVVFLYFVRRFTTP